MARNEPSLVPEWLRQGQGSGNQQSQAHHRYHGDGGGPLTPRRYSGASEPPPRSPGGSYAPPGRRTTGGERPPYDRSQSSSFNRARSNDAVSQGGAQEKLSPEAKNRKLAEGNGRKGGEDHQGGPEQTSGPSLPTAMPTTTGTLTSNVQKAAFERNFPVLGDKFGRFMPSPNSVPSPRRGLRNGEGGEGWSSRLVELPSPAVRGGAEGVVESPRTSEGGARTPKMSEAVQQAMQEQQHRLAPNASSESQKQDELVLKKMKQLIPLKPSMPRNLLLKPSKKPLHSTTPQLAPPDTKSTVRRSEDPSRRAPPVLLNGTVTRLQIPGAVSNLANPPSPAGNATTPNNGPKPSAATQKRNDFFKALRKKALSPKERAAEGNGLAGEGRTPSAEQGPETEFARSESLDGPVDSRSGATNVPIEEAPSIRRSNGVPNGVSANGYLNGGTIRAEPRTNGSVEEKGLRNGQDDVEVVGDPEEEEAAFLRSLGWTGPEEDDEEGALTEEEIRAFFSQTAKLDLEPKAAAQNGAQTYEPSNPIHVMSSGRGGVPSRVEAIVGSYSSLSSGLSSSDDESDC